MLKIWKFSSAGRASALQAEGHRFEPCNFHFFMRSGGSLRFRQNLSRKRLQAFDELEQRNKQISSSGASTLKLPVFLGEKRWALWAAALWAGLLANCHTACGFHSGNASFPKPFRDYAVTKVTAFLFAIKKRQSRSLAACFFNKASICRFGKIWRMGVCLPKQFRLLPPKRRPLAPSAYNPEKQLTNSHPPASSANVTAVCRNKGCINKKIQPVLYLKIDNLSIRKK